VVGTVCFLAGEYFREAARAGIRQVRYYLCQ
jgi:hypothetical protein